MPKIYDDPVSVVQKSQNSWAQASLDPSDIDSLYQSAISYDVIEANGLFTSKCGYGGCLVFPYRGLDGIRNGFSRRRLHRPPGDRKYDQDEKTGARAYFPSGSCASLRDGTGRIFVTEGEKKALALDTLGETAIGLGGVDSGSKDGELIPDLRAVDWEHRDVYVAFDYDPKLSTRQNVENARRKLVRLIYAQGVSSVYLIDLPPAADGGKQGIDDFLFANRSNPKEALERLVITATRAGDERKSAIRSIYLILSPPKLSREAYHGITGEFLDTIEPLTEATAPGILAHFLSAVGAIIGSNVYHFAAGKQPPRINTVLVGPTARGRKGTSFEPVKELMSRVDSQFWMSQQINGLATGEGLINKVADRDGNDDKRVYVVEPEFSRVLLQARREGNILSQIIREAFDSGDLRVITRSNPLYAHGAHICLTGHITPEELQQRFDSIEMVNGFGNRFLWFAVKSEKLLPYSPPLPERELGRFAERLCTTIQFIRESKLGRVDMDDPALKIWESLYSKLSDDKPGFAGSLLARGSSIVLRLALIYALLDMSQVIQPVHLQAAMAVWRYSEQSVETLFGGRSGNPLSERLVELFDTYPELTQTELHSHMKRCPVEEINNALNVLKEMGVIELTIRKPVGAGRPGKVWKKVTSASPSASPLRGKN